MVWNGLGWFWTRMSTEHRLPQTTHCDHFLIDQWMTGLRGHVPNGCVRSIFSQPTRQRFRTELGPTQLASRCRYDCRRSCATWIKIVTKEDHDPMDNHLELIMISNIKDINIYIYIYIYISITIYIYYIIDVSWNRQLVLFFLVIWTHMALTRWFF